MGNSKWINGDDFKREKDRKFKCLRKRDMLQILVGCAVFTFGAAITVASVLECVESLILGFLVAISGAIVVCTSRLCWKE